jgi:hypothetical protein
MDCTRQISCRVALLGDFVPATTNTVANLRVDSVIIKGCCGNECGSARARAATGKDTSEERLREKKKSVSTGAGRGERVTTAHLS